MLTNVSVPKLMRQEGLSIVKKLSKVKSDYVLSRPDDRYLIRLGEKSFSATHQVKKDDNWITVAKSLFKGSLENVQNKCMDYIELLTKNKYC